MWTERGREDVLSSVLSGGDVSAGVAVTRGGSYTSPRPRSVAVLTLPPGSIHLNDGGFGDPGPAAAAASAPIGPGGGGFYGPVACFLSVVTGGIGRGT